MMRSILAAACVAAAAAGCTNTLGPITLTIVAIDATVTIEHIRLVTDSGEVESPLVRARFLDEAQIVAPLRVDSVLHNGHPVPLASADSGVYQPIPPMLPSLEPGTMQHIRVVGGTAIPSFADSILLPESIASLTAPRTLSISRGFSLEWSAGRDASATVEIRISSTVGALDVYTIGFGITTTRFSTPDDGSETVSPEQMGGLLPGERLYLQVSRGNSLMAKAGTRDYALFASSTVAMPVTIVP